MNEICLRYYKSPYGELVLGSVADQLCLCDWRYRKLRTAIDQRLMTHLNARFVAGDSRVLQRTLTQLDEYFSFQRQAFDLPLRMVGSDFQQAVWRELLKIPYGQTRSYLQLAEALGNRNAVRAVAGANGANGLSIIIPCHRIIGSDGQLTGYAGGLRAKEKLLQLEQNLFSQ